MAAVNCEAVNVSINSLQKKKKISRMSVALGVFHYGSGQSMP